MPRLTVCHLSRSNWAHLLPVGVDLALRLALSQSCEAKLCSRLASLAQNQSLPLKAKVSRTSSRLLETHYGTKNGENCLSLGRHMGI